MKDVLEAYHPPPLFHKLFEKFYWYSHRKTVEIQHFKIRICLISLYAGVKISESPRKSFEKL
jgi:hypothetical protein